MIRNWRHCIFSLVGTCLSPHPNPEGNQRHSRACGTTSCTLPGTANTRWILTPKWTTGHRKWPTSVKWMNRSSRWSANFRKPANKLRETCTVRGAGCCITIRISGAWTAPSTDHTGVCGRWAAHGSASICGKNTNTAAIRNIWSRCIPWWKVLLSFSWVFSSKNRNTNGWWFALLFHLRILPCRIRSRPSRPGQRWITNCCSIFLRRRYGQPKCWERTANSLRQWEERCNDWLQCK